MVSPRWRKLAADLRAARGRVAVMLIAITLSLAAVGAVLGARTVLGREIAASYASSQPADATLALAGVVDDALLAEVRARPGVAAADRRESLHARVRVGPAAWQPLVLFVASEPPVLNTFRGAWPPARGTLLLERTAPQVMGLGDATSVTVQTAHGPPTEVAIAGTVHDAGQAPNWQEHRGVAYTSIDTLAALGEAPVLHELLVRFDGTASTADAEASAGALAVWLGERGHPVHEVRVPRWHQHPHQGLMRAVQLVMLGFSLMLLVLSSIVTATMLSSILSRQVREIGVMKAIGASTRQLAGIYGALVLGIGVIAVAIAAPLAYLGGHAMIGKVGAMMNLRVLDAAIPAWVFAVQVALGLLVPLAIAAVPILRATRITVRQALAAGGAERARRMPAFVPLAVRNALRRPARLAMTLALLVTGATVVIAAANLQGGLAAITDKLEVARHHDLELRLHEPAPVAEVAALADVSGVRTVEAWAAASAALGRPERAVDVVHTYPDGGHGSFLLVAPPDGGSALVAYPVLEGRWLAPGDTDAIVLGHNAMRGTHPGERVTVTVDGVRATWTVVGIVEEVGGMSGFVTADAFRRATRVSGARLIRIATTPGADVLPEVERALAARGHAVEYAMPARVMHSIIDDHIALVVRAIQLLAAVLALVGLLGLGSAMAIGVAERTREIGVLKAIGASDGRIAMIVLGEAAAIGGLASVLAAVLALPLTAVVEARIAAGGFLAPPTFTISAATMVIVPLALIAGSVLASLGPARRAARLSVRAALAEV